MPCNKTVQQVETSLEKLDKYVQQQNYKGYDPYDALCSFFLSSMSFQRKYVRIAFEQFLKRCPLNLRPAFGISKGYNPKGLGLFVWSYAKMYRAYQRPESLKQIDYMFELLNRYKSVGYNGNGWGYNFNWQSRAFYVPRYTPTVVNSSFIGHALLDTYSYTGKEQALEMALPIEQFILRDLNRTQDGDSFCFSYTPGDHLIVHNANLLGASLLIRLYKYSGNEEAKEAALSSLAYSMKYQREDGSWYYADTNIQKWIDSFHTGFNLQSLLYFLQEGFASEYLEGFNKGTEFYANNFFLEDGTPKYYHNKIYPIDIHCPAQAVVFFLRLGDKYLDLVERILHWTIQNMQDPKGFFYFQKEKYFTNKTSHIRWGQAWTMHALTEYLMFQSINSSS